MKQSNQHIQHLPDSHSFRGIQDKDIRDIGIIPDPHSFRDIARSCISLARNLGRVVAVVEDISTLAIHMDVKASDPFWVKIKNYDGIVRLVEANDPTDDSPLFFCFERCCFWSEKIITNNFRKFWVFTLDYTDSHKRYVIGKPAQGIMVYSQDFLDVLNKVLSSL